MSSMRVVRLSECCEIVSGATPSTSVDGYWNGDICWATPKDLSDLNGHYISDTPRKLTQEGLQSCAASILPPNSVLFSSRAPIGHVAVNTVPMATNQGFKSFIPKSGVTDAKFLFHWLRANRSYLESLGNGATFKEVSKATVSRIEIPLPPIPEQRRIATILDQADALRAKRREALAQLASLTQSIFIEMFGDPGSNPKRWPEIQLGNLIVGKPNNGIFKKNEEYGEGFPVAWVEELFRGNAINLSNSRKLLPTPKEIENYGLRHGDVLFCRSSLKLAGIGYNNVYLGEDNKALFECHVIRISPDKSKIEPRFLNFALRMPNQRQKLFKFAKTVTMSTIDQDGLQQISLPIPPLSQQESFVEKLAAIDGIKAKHGDTLSELDALSAALQHRAFRGEL